MLAEMYISDPQETDNAKYEKMFLSLLKGNFMLTG